MCAKVCVHLSISSLVHLCGVHVKVCVRYNSGISFGFQNFEIYDNQNKRGVFNTVSVFRLFV